MAALATGLGSFVAILGEIAGVVLCPAAAMALLTALATCFGRTFAIVGEVSTTVLTAEVPGARGLFAIFGEIAWITGVSLFSHLRPLSLFQAPDHLTRCGVNGRGTPSFAQTFCDMIDDFLISNVTAVSLNASGEAIPGGAARH